MKIRSGKEIVEIIDLLLQEKNLTRKDFCKSLNIPPSTIATWKTRNIFPTVEPLALIAQKLEISLDWLVCGELFDIPGDFRDLLERFNSCSVSQQKIIFEILDEFKNSK